MTTARLVFVATCTASTPFGSLLVPFRCTLRYLAPDRLDVSSRRALNSVAMQFGAGPELAAQCTHATTPDGWRAWLPESDGPLPEGLAKRAAALAADPGIPLGVTESYPLPGVTTLIRVEPRAWAHDASGALVQGCFRSGGVYLPDDTPEGAGVVTPPTSRIDKAVGIFTIVSLVVGTAATLYSWGK